MESHDEIGPSFAQTMASFAATIEHRSLAREVRDAATLRIVDTLGCIRGSAGAEPVTNVIRMYRTFGGRSNGTVPASTVVGMPDTAPVETAAFVNGIAARYLDFNDIYLSREAIHPSDNIAVALALAEALGRDGSELITAVARGYEVHCRLADSVSTRKGGWDNVILGAIAASVMAGSLLRLDLERQVNAINIAAVGNVALMQTRVGALSMWKAIAAAYAARAGLFAALLACHEVKGPDRALDGTHGLFSRVTGEPDAQVSWDNNGSLRMLDTHLKAYPCQYFTQTAIDAALALRDRARIGFIRKIAVGTFEFGRVAAADTPEKWHPRTRETADHSMPYCVAAALLDGRLGEGQFRPERLGAEDMRSLIRKIEVFENPEFTRQYPQRVPTRIRIEHLDGSSIESTVDYPTGHSRKPMSRDQVEAKYLDLAGPRAGSHLGSLWRLDSLTSGETGALLRAALA